MLRQLASALLLFLCALDASAALDVFGYAGAVTSDSSNTAAIANAGIRANVATVDFPAAWTDTQLGAIDADLQARGSRGGLFLDSVLFRKQLVTASPCADMDGPFVVRLRGNWRDRLAAFAAHNGAWISPERTAFIVVHAEINNQCVPDGDVALAALAVKQLWPSIPSVLGFGRSPGAKPQPATIPAAIDWVGFYKYGTYDPAVPSHAYNADAEYLNELNALTAKLASHQRILLVFDGWWGEYLHANLNSHRGPNTGWPQWYLANVAVNYERFAQSQPRVVGLLSFLWPSTPIVRGTAELPQTVRDAHRGIACRMSGGC